MPAIHIDSLSFAYTSAVEVLVDISANIGPGWTGVVGANGSGKSTLFSLIDSHLTPTSGAVTIDPAGALILRCHQEVTDLEPQVSVLIDQGDPMLYRWLGRMDLDPNGLERWSTLSPGQRKRWQLAGALATQPDVLLLDEPTNHLDEAGIDLIGDALSRFNGVGLLISHDRSLLDRLTTRTLRISDGSVRLWNAPYSSARDAWQAEMEELAAERSRLKTELNKTRRRISEARQSAEKANARRSRQVRQSDPSDHDARSMAAKKRHADGQAAGEQRRRTDRAQGDRLVERLNEVRISKQLGSSIDFEYEPADKEVLFVHSGRLSAGSHLLADDIDISLHRGQHVWLRGSNGSGKTTLMKSLVEGALIPPNRFVHIPQEITREQGAALLDRVAELPNEERGRVLTVVAALGADPDRLIASNDPSPGETRKLALALGVGSGTWAVLVDEPTNHLDIIAVEILQRAMTDYPGAILLVTHDRLLAERVTSVTWTIEERTLKVSGG